MHRDAAVRQRRDIRRRRGPHAPGHQGRGIDRVQPAGIGQGDRHRPPVFGIAATGNHDRRFFGRTDTVVAHERGRDRQGRRHGIQGQGRVRLRRRVAGQVGNIGMHRDAAVRQRRDIRRRRGPHAPGHQGRGIDRVQPAGIGQGDRHRPPVFGIAATGNHDRRFFGRTDTVVAHERGRNRQGRRHRVQRQRRRRDRAVAGRIGAGLGHRQRALGKAGGVELVLARARIQGRRGAGRALGHHHAGHGVGSTRQGQRRMRTRLAAVDIGVTIGGGHHGRSRRRIVDDDGIARNCADIAAGIHRIGVVSALRQAMDIHGRGQARRGVGRGGRRRSTA